MRNIRKLFFRNAAGAEWGLNGEQGVYAASLAGFGVALTPNFVDLNRGFFVPVNDESEPQSTVTFTLYFTQSPYDTFKRLVDWLSASGTITLVYTPVGKQPFYRDVTINFLQKGELNAVGWLEVPCSFMCNTPWYLPAPTALSLETGAEGEDKRYDYTYSDDLRYGVDSSAALAGTIYGAGHVPGSLELSYYGSVTNPRIRLTGNVTGKTYGVCSVAAALTASDVLKFSTRYEDSYVKRISALGMETDLLDALDLSSNPFFHIPVDEPCTISIEADSALPGRADLQVFYYYRSV